MTRMSRTVASKNGMSGSHEIGLPPLANDFSDGFVLFRSVEPKFPNRFESLHRPKLTVMIPPHTIATTLITVPHEPSLNQASLCGQPLVRAMSTPTLHIR